MLRHGFGRPGNWTPVLHRGPKEPDDGAQGPTEDTELLEPTQECDPDTLRQIRWANAKSGQGADTEGDQQPCPTAGPPSW